MTYHPDAETTRVLQTVAGGLDDIFNGKERSGKVGFVLLTFSFGDPDGTNVNYVSNAERDGIVATLHGLLARFEGRHSNAPGAVQ